MERYAEIIAALKIRTSNKKGRHLSTARAIRLLEEDGVETPDGLVLAPPGLLKRATVDRVLRASGLDHARVVRPIAAARFQAKRERALAVRHEPLRPEAGRGPALDRARSRQADLDAVLGGR